jgi:hypothetical protein
LNLLETAFSLFEKNYVPAGVIDEISYGENKDEEAFHNIMENTKGLLNLSPDDVYQKLIGFNFRVEKEIYENILREFY